MPKLPVFVSRPTRRTAEQQSCYEFLLDRLEEIDIEGKTIEASDYPFEHPLKEVRALAERCAGGVVLGFAHVRLAPVREKPAPRRGSEAPPLWSPTPWNNLEAGILYGLRLPLLIFKDEGVEGGIFDRQATGEHVHLMPDDDARTNRLEQLRAVFLHWRSRVEDRYFSA